MWGSKPTLLFGKPELKRGALDWSANLNITLILDIHVGILISRHATRAHRTRATTALVTRSACTSRVQSIVDEITCPREYLYLCAYCLPKHAVEKIVSNKMKQSFVSTFYQVKKQDCD